MSDRSEWLTAHMGDLYAENFRGGEARSVVLEVAKLLGVDLSLAPLEGEMWSRPNMRRVVTELRSILEADRPSDLEESLLAVSLRVRLPRSWGMGDKTVCSQRVAKYLPPGARVERARVVESVLKEVVGTVAAKVASEMEAARLRADFGLDSRSATG